MATAGGTHSAQRNQREERTGDQRDVAQHPLLQAGGRAVLADNLQAEETLAGTARMSRSSHHAPSATPESTTPSTASQLGPNEITAPAMPSMR
jgi:hypothetical protein